MSASGRGGSSGGLQALHAPQRAGALRASFSPALLPAATLPWGWRMPTAPSSAGTHL